VVNIVGGQCALEWYNDVEELECKGVDELGCRDVETAVVLFRHRVGVCEC